MPTEKFEHGQSKKQFWKDLAFKYLPEMRLLMKGGKISKKEGWRNVVEHSLVQVAASKKLSELLGLSKEDTDRLVRAAACHDWAKRLERRPQDFTEEEKREASDLLQRLNPDKNLMDATGTGFLEKALMRGESSFLERLQFYIDDITKGSEIVPVDERIDEVEARRQDLNNDPELTRRLGGRYWDKERELDHKVEQEIFDLLRARGINVNLPREIPLFLVRLIEADISKGGQS